MNTKRMKEILIELRYARCRSMLSFWNGKAGGYVEACDVSSAEKMALWELTLNAHEYRAKELFNQAESPAFLLDQAA